MSRGAEINTMIAKVMHQNTHRLGGRKIVLFGSRAAGRGLPDCLSPKACLRQAFAAGWVDDETIWLAMLDARNRMAHTYDVRRALQIYDSLPKYCSALGKQLAALQSLSNQ